MRIGDFSPLFGKNVVYLRGLCNMSQRTLARLVGTSVYYIRKIENAKDPVCLDYRIFERLCTVFSITANDIIRVDLEGIAFTLPVYTVANRKTIEEYSIM